MDKETPQSQHAADEPILLDRAGLCLLSLDGGGVRGMSMLYILQSLMGQLNAKRRECGLPSVKPCDIFDLIGGTSSGGLIAIMLGHLEMDVDDCIAAYRDLNSQIFRKQIRRFPFGISGQVLPRFDSIRLREAVEGVIRRNGFSPEAPFNDGRRRRCRVFVCVTNRDLYDIVLVRNYDAPGSASLPATLCQAALATSAAPGYFDPVAIRGRHFVDGALGANNPVEQVEAEASDLWSPESTAVQRLVKCFVSLGTGSRSPKPVERSLSKFLSKTLPRIVTERHHTALKFMARWKQPYKEKRYFRFEVDQGLQDTKLHHYKSNDLIEAATERHLRDPTHKSEILYCAQNLSSKKEETTIDFESILLANVPKINYSGSIDPPRNTPLPLDQKRIGHNVFPQRLEVAAVTVPPNTPIFDVPLRNNPKFTGRQPLIDSLVTDMFTSNGKQDFALTGLGGIGKTQVALHLAYWLKKNKPGYSVFWVSALSKSTFRQGYANIAKALGIPSPRDDENSMMLVRQHLSSDSAGLWLLVVDNADDLSVLNGAPSDGGDSGSFKYLPQSDLGLTLFTTRVREVACFTGAEIVDISDMDEDEAKTLLESLVTRKALLGDDGSVEELLRKLTYFPLAITQAAAYINTKSVSVRTYLKLLQGTEVDVSNLLSKRFPDPTRYNDDGNAVFTTWLVSLDLIRNTDPDAYELLRFIACIEPKAIPLSILPRLGSDEATYSALGTLKAYSFLTAREEDQVYDMHSLVHQATMIWLNRDGSASDAKKRAITHLASIFPWPGWDNRPLWTSYLPHAFRALRNNAYLNLDEFADLQLLLGHCLTMNGRPSEAVVCFEGCYKDRIARLKPEDPALMRSMYYLAWGYAYDDHGNKAVEILERLILVLEPYWEHNLSMLFRSMSLLGILYGHENRPTTGLDMLDKAARIRNKSICKLSYTRQIGNTTSLAKGHVESRATQALPTIESGDGVVGETPPDARRVLLSWLQSLSQTYTQAGQADKPIEVLDKAFLPHQRSRRRSNLTRVALMDYLTRIYLTANEAETKSLVLEPEIELGAQVLPPPHSPRFESMCLLSRAYLVTDQADKAAEILEQVVTFEEQTRRVTDLARIEAIVQLFRAYRKLGDFEKCKQQVARTRMVATARLNENAEDPLRKDTESLLKWMKASLATAEKQKTYSEQAAATGSSVPLQTR